MSFLSPYLLWGALAAGIPIALHFFFRSRYRTVPWAAMKFLLTSIEQTSRRLKFQELLLLCLRVLLLVLLALALARPVSSVMRGSGQGEAIDAVFLFDTSYSMGGKEGNSTRLALAKNSALQILEQLPPHSTVQVVTVSDRGQSLGPRSPSNLDQAKHLIQNLELTNLAGDLAPGLLEAVEALKRGPSSNKELYLFSDMQRQGFEKKAGQVAQLFQKIREQATLLFVRTGSSNLKNASIVGISPQSGVPRPGQRVDFGVLVQNSGNEEISDVEVSLMIDNNPAQVESKTIPALKPGEIRVVTLSGLLEKPGLRLLTAQIKNDDLPGDNRYDQVVPVRSNVNVLIVDGSFQKDNRTPSSYFLQHALQPVKDNDRLKYYLQPRVVAPFVATSSYLQKQDAVFLVNAKIDDQKNLTNVLSTDFLEELANFVKSGKSLVIYCGDNVVPESYNRLLGEKLGLLPLPLKKIHTFSVKSPLLVNRDSFNLPAFVKFKEDKFYQGFSDIEVMKMIEVGESVKNSEQKSSEEAIVALRYSNGMPAVVTKKVGLGEVVFISTGTDFDANDLAHTWSDWPLHLKEFVPFVDVLMSHLLHGSSDRHNLVAGETLTWYPKEKEPRSYYLNHPNGKVEPLGVPEPVAAGERPVVQARDLIQAGIYKLTTALPPSLANREVSPPTKAEQEGTPIAVISDLRESEKLETLTDEQIDKQLDFSPIHLNAERGQVKDSSAERLNREWTLWWVLALIGLLGLESWLAFWCGKAW